MKIIFSLLDIIIIPFLVPSAIVLKIIRRVGVHRLSKSKRILQKIGVFPIINHYYEPLFELKHLECSNHQARNLPGINWNLDEQLNLLNNFDFYQEIIDEKLDIDNQSFCSGDAEFLYNLVRYKKPRNFFEIGSGNSTKIVMQAILKNQEYDESYKCNHVCVEPYECLWLEASSNNITVIREKVESLDTKFFSCLGEDDILFIDSSHIIRPHGDILYEYLELLPTLKKGVIVHIHDIFSPYDYLQEWITDQVKFWNEQYLLEAFLTNNLEWKIIASLNLLHHQHYNNLKKACPYLTPAREPGSFYIQKK